MRKVKWIFFAYLAVVVMIILGIGASFAFVRPRDPGTFYSTYASDIKTLDPAEISDVPSSNIAGQMFECLYNYAYGKIPYSLIPELATALPEISPDGKTYTIHLRRGVHYFDPDFDDPALVVFAGGTGPEITAKDFLYAWKRVTNFHIPNSNAAIFEKVVGIDDWAKYTASVAQDKVDYSRDISGFAALDDYTIRITLTEPAPQMIFGLAHLPTAPMAKAAVDKFGAKVRMHPIGSGPYALSFRRHLPQQQIVLTANPIYRGQPTIDPGTPIAEADRLPHMKRVQLDYFDEDLPPWYMFRRGLLDISAIPKETFGQAIQAGGGAELTPDMEAAGVRLIKSASPTIYYLGFNMLDPVVGKNKPLRQAMSMAVDREEYIKVFRNGRGELPIGPIPPGFPAFDPKGVNPYTRFNLPAAKQKLKEAEAIQGGTIPPITLLIPGTDTAARQLGDFVKRQMLQIGVIVEMDYTNWANFLEQVEKKKTAQFYQLGWVTDYPDEQNVLQLFYSKNISEGGLNSANYTNPEFDKLYEKASVMSDSPKRTRLYREMEKIVNEDTPWLLQYYPVDFVLTQRWVENYRLTEYVHGTRAQAKIDENIRAEGMGHK